MGKNLSYFLFLLWLCYLIVSSVLLFTRGFLLSRVVQKTNASCVLYSEIPCTVGVSSYLNTTKSREEQCSQNEKIISILNEYNSASSICLPPRGKVVLLIVDALRHDFTVYDESIKNPLPFQNKLPVIDKLTKSYPKLTRTYKFIADPPTTTMQRLKGLTTGSLPTFIDAGSNFATSEINEDNIVDQLIRNNYNVVFMGDDTWNGLYPNRFIRNYPYPSFNVWDLDTVDNGVRDNLYPELNKTDWNLLVGHFLGVDHCGHRYGPNHPEMKRKLGEINSVIENVVEQIDENTILFVIGDHGMTATGDHGGESKDEVTAGLFVYSKRPLLNLGNKKESVKQVDIVPTLSTILGVPIPFQNLGILILNCLPITDTTHQIENWRLALYSLWANVQQVLNYIREYAETTDTFSEESLNDFYSKFTLLNGKIFAVNSEESFLRTSKELTDFVSNLRKMCENVWIQFDSFSMTRGLLFLFLSVFFVFVITDGIPTNRLPEIFISSFLTCSYIMLFLATIFGGILYYLDYVDNLLSVIFFATGLVSQVMLAMLIIQNWEIISLNWYSRSKKERIPNLICRLVLAFNLCGLFSNSYIIEESFVLLFLLVTVILVGTIGITSSGGKVESKPKTSTVQILKWARLKLILLAILIAASVRTSMYFWRCRQEQQWCFASPHEVSTITAKMETTKLQWAITVVCLTVFVFITKEWLKSCGNLNGYSPTVTFIKFIPTVIVVCIAGFWVLQRVPQNKPHSKIFKLINVLAWTVYGFISSGILATIINPLCTYVIPGKDSGLLQNEENVIPRLFQKIKSSFAEKEKPNEDIPVVCGLGTVYSSVFIVIGIYLTLLFALLLGDAVAPSAVIMFMTSCFVLIIISVLRIEKVTSIEELFEVPNISILVWIILSQYFFYGSGHQPTFPNISWDAAFIGTSGVFTNNIIPGALIIINTFCSYILMGILLPLIVITPFTVFVMIPSIVRRKTELQLVSARGEVVLFERDNLMLTSVFTLSCKYIAGHAIRVFASMLAATIHCRHLMVWNIFAPKLIFESIGMMVTLASVVTGYLILVRINKKVESLIVNLNKMS